MCGDKILGAAVLALWVTAAGAPARAAIHRVDTQAVGANDGTSWQDAYTDLQAALAAAQAGDEIWVAAGRYVPGTSSSATFRLGPGTALYGGFAGSETERRERDWNENLTLLSGDLLGNDVGFVNNVENAHNVVTGSDNAVLDGFTIEGGLGGGLRNLHASPAIVHCTFQRNDGSAIYNEFSSPVVINSRFLGNNAFVGGAIHNRGSSPALLNCIFVGNTATDRGGALYNNMVADFPSLVLIPSEPRITNCTFTLNSASAGGAMSSRGDDGTGSHNPVPTFALPRVYNSILWANRADAGSEVSNYFAMPGFGNSLLAGSSGSAGWNGSLGQDLGGNLDADPLLADAAGADGIAGTTDDRPQPDAGSPCLDAGSRSYLPPDHEDIDGDGNSGELLPVDLQGRPRIQASQVDLGAYEGPASALAVSTSRLSVPEGGTESFEVFLAVEPAETIEVQVLFESGDGDISVQSGASLFFGPEDHSIPQTVVLAAAPDPDLRSGLARLRVSAPDLGSKSIEATEIDSDPVPPVLHVVEGLSAPGWADAFPSLQEALDAAGGAGGTVREIWVAEGTYRPSRPAQPGNSGSATFQMQSGVGLYGGFAGTETARDQRNPSGHPTILSGDLQADDAEGSKSDNSERVVTGATGATLDGFILTAAYGGSALYNQNASPVVSRCLFVDNESFQEAGAAVINDDRSAPVFSDCVFLRNRGRSGAAMSSSISSPTVKNSVFLGNKSEYGGAWYQSSGSAKIVNCVFAGNTATEDGGAIAYEGFLGDTFKLVNCTLTKNRAKAGGGIRLFNGTAELRNCILAGNRATVAGNEVHKERNVSARYLSCNLRGSRGSGPRWNGALGKDGGGNLDVPPLFVDGADPDGPDDVPATADDGLRLQRNSRCVDAGLARGAPQRDLLGQRRPRPDGIDLGAYETTP